MHANKKKSDLIKTDLLVIGSGIAGCSTALIAADSGLNVTIVSKDRLIEECSSWYAQGGIVYLGKNDSAELLAQDIIAAGAKRTNPKAASFLAKKAKSSVNKILIDRLQIAFDRQSKNGLHLTKEAAHSRARILHVKDYTGQAILEAFLSCLKKHKRVKFLSGYTAVDLITLAHHSTDPLQIYEPQTVVGAYLFDSKSGEVIRAMAAETVLSTGGVGQLYLHTTNPESARGDGIAMAYRVGARVMNMEYIQFHPTALYHPQARRFLISEAVRGEGGILIDHHGQRFMPKYQKKAGELAPRDVVARAIHRQMIEEESSCVYLDISHKKRNWIEQRFPKILKQCLAYKIDIREQPIPVVPAAHYSCGGIAVDLKGQTTVNGLRAVGEVACNGLHGANRLASTSLLEGLVFGIEAGQDIAKKKHQFSYPAQKIRSWEHRRDEIDPALLTQDWSTLRRTMWNYVGLMRNNHRLNRAQRIVGSLSEAINRFYRYTTVHDYGIGLRHAVLTANLIIHAARLNRHCIGSHYRTD